MKPAPFDFYAPDTEEQVRELLAEHGEDARLLAGGQSLVPLMNMRILQPAVIISLNRCSALAYLREEGDFIVCGALTRQACAEDSALVGRHVPLLAAALPHVGVQANRNVGTVCVEASRTPIRWPNYRASLPRWTQRSSLPAAITPVRWRRGNSSSPL